MFFVSPELRLKSRIFRHVSLLYVSPLILSLVDEVKKEHRHISKWVNLFIPEV